MILQSPEFPLEQLFSQLIHYLITGWGIIILIGSFASAILIAVGFIYWFTGFDQMRGRRMVVGGIILFIAIQWLAVNPPWQLILG